MQWNLCNLNIFRQIVFFYVWNRQIFTFDRLNFQIIQILVQNLNLGLHCGLFIQVSIYLGCNMKTGKNIYIFFLPNKCRFYNNFSPSMLHLNLVISKSKGHKMPLQLNNYKFKKSKVPIVYYYIYYKGAIFFPYRFVHEKLFIGVQNNKVWFHLYLFFIFRQEMCASQNTPVYINYQTV